MLVHVHGFLPYFYVPAPPGFQNAHKQSFLSQLDAGVRSHFGKQRLENSSAGSVVDIHLVHKASIFGFQGNKKTLFLKIFLRTQSDMATAKRTLREGIDVVGLGRIHVETPFESNIPYPLRFMIDTKIPGFSWVELPPKSYTIREPKDSLSNCQLEVDIMFNNIISHQPDGEWSQIAPLRILSFDIECAGRKGVFPDAQQDPVIQIANVVTVQGSSKPFIRNVFTLNTCANIVGSQVLCHGTESELLMSWSEFVREVDPDVIIGYNINGFDFPYLLDRAEALKLQDFAFLGRLSASKTNAKDSRFSSKAYGTRDTKNINIEGRLQLDMLQIMQRDYKLRSYSLNSVCSHFLGTSIL